MNTMVWTYVTYLAISIALTIWVARVLFKHGGRFLVEAMHGDAGLADSWNHLLVVGFYLVNLGYISFNLKVRTVVLDPQGAIEVLASQLGLVLLVLGIVHFFNLYAFNRLRQNRDFVQDPPTLDPEGVQARSVR
jgi:hypothetical protein